MNLKFMRRVSEQDRAIRSFIIVKNKLMSVFNASVLFNNSTDAQKTDVNLLNRYHLEFIANRKRD